MNIKPNELLTLAQATRTANALEAMFDPEADLQGAMLAALAMACLHNIQSGAIAADTLADQASRIRDAVLGAANPNAIGMDPLILAGLIEQLHMASIPAQVLGDMVDNLRTELSRQPAEFRQTGRIRMLEAMLERADCAVKPAGPPASYGNHGVSADCLLDANDEQLLDIVDHGFAGGIRFEPEAGVVLGALMLALLRDYRIDIAGRMLRAMLVHDHDAQSALEGLHFIVVQRGSDGLYGYSDPFSDRYPDAATRNRELRLPVTLNALWMFATALAVAGRRK
ncbi:MAG: hypothetical protein ACJAVZ_003551 [Afipia broomeae]|uniref:hypothetical protein n=1 Tax=Qipengyuania profunda TaxID=3113984 RepID=UPI002A18E1B6|nr:hypothetical protein [Qipengyuania sp. HL-TH1]WPL57898.1 hypothetical protein SD421_05550 [Qipengyuania sp. HL-TH5]